MKFFENIFSEKNHQNSRKKSCGGVLSGPPGALGSCPRGHLDKTESAPVHPIFFESKLGVAPREHRRKAVGATLVNERKFVPISNGNGALFYKVHPTAFLKRLRGFL